ncbi:BTAD domain-containing putative transcriptional regulator [Rugosimonospora acidiphila]|uniref:BTAD domain-containing putative transcriptional regulator n=1 Tax=Rugosimonospora acidiphila TaxID=556531 RepID=A0ABP9SWA8_9ACTN
MEFRLLGPVEAVHDGRLVPLGRRQERCVLAILALEPGRLVPAQRLADLLWEEQPPLQARAAVQAMVSHLRAALRSAEPAGPQVVTRGGGYLLATGADTVDLHRFRARVTEARATTSLRTRADLLSAALKLWRGPALADVADERLRARLCPDLDELHLQAREDWLEARLELGEHDEVTEPLKYQVAEHPLRERSQRLLMLALYRGGRRGEALASFREARRLLVEELGLEPGPELQGLQRAILSDDGDRAHPARTGLGQTSPAQLPGDIVPFTGRAGQLAELDSLLSGDPGSTTAVIVVAISGTAGVGKTTLAVHWAQRIRDRFPDGQLYVNLRGFDPSGSPTSRAEALRDFLDAFGVQPSQVPPGIQAQAALYRSLMAGKRVLVLLDNARDAEQVHALLPGTPGCVAVVTSRDQLSGLVATDGAHLLTLDLLTPDESRQLLARRVGANRVAAESEAVNQIVDRCAGLPLALAIVAARAASEASVPLSYLTEEMGGSLGSLDADDVRSGLRRVFSWSYRTLSAPGARLFRLLGLHPGPDITAPAAASLAGVPAGLARSLLAELRRAHLITQRTAGRYSFHDLLRAYAAELVWLDETEEQRYAASVRLLDHYTDTADRAANLLHPGRHAGATGARREGAEPESIADLDAAMNWFTAEHLVLLAVLARAGADGHDAHVWHLAWSLRNFLDRRRLWPDQTSVQHAGLDAALRLGDRSAQALARRSLGRAYAELGRDHDAEHHYRQAFALFSELGDDAGRAGIHMSLGMLAQRQGRTHESLRQHEQALTLFERADHVSGRANAMNNIAMNHMELGDFQQSLSIGEAALALIQKVGDTWGEASTWDTLGNIHHQLGHYDRAVDCHRTALELVRQAGDRYHESLALRHLADAHDAARDPSAAADARYAALEILDELDHPDAALVRAELRERKAAV